jgi:hypothetical protein
MKLSFISFSVAFAAATTALHAATVTGTLSTPVTGTFALPSTPGSDWAYYMTSPPVGGAPTNTSNSGSGLFTVSPLGPAATSLLGSGTPITSFYYSFTNGTSPETSTPNTGITGIRNNLTDTAAVGNGVQMTLNAQPQAGQINLWIYTFNATSSLKVYGYDTEVGGTGDLLFSGLVPNVAGKVAHQFSFDYVPTGTNDALRFEYLMEERTGELANIGFAGISFTPVPEPGVVSCAAVAALSCGFLRRRRMA